MTWRPAAIEHARAAAPQEACGLVIEVDGVERYWPCANVHPLPASFFRLGLEDWAAAEDQGRIVAVVHSHPDGSAHPSDADRIECERGTLPWHIVGLPEGIWCTLAPTGWRAPLLGRQFSYGALDCYTLVRDVMDRVFGVAVPDFERGLAPREQETHLYQQHFAAAGYVELSTGAALQPADLIVMTVGARQPNHGAVYLGDGIMVHHLEHRLSLREPYGPAWQRCTRLRLRHRAFVDAAPAARLDLEGR